MRPIPTPSAFARLGSFGVTWVLFVSLAGPARAQELPSAVAAAAREFDPELNFPAQDGIVHLADFDGDGRDDVAAVLTADMRRALVVFLASQRGYEAYPLYARLPAGEFDLRVVQPGRRRVLDPQGMIEHATPGLELVFPGRSSALYIWRDGRFRVFELVGR